MALATQQQRRAVMALGTYGPLPVAKSNLDVGSRLQLCGLMSTHGSVTVAEPTLSAQIWEFQGDSTGNIWRNEVSE